MKKLQFVSLFVLFLSVLLWTAGRTILPLPDWAVRANGVIQMITLAALAFSTVRLLKKV